MAFQFNKATKAQSKLRAALFAPSGGGKTFTSLRVATGMANEIDGKIAFIDTERGSASKYANRFEFDVLELEKYDIDTYVGAINAAAQAGYDVLIIDSLSHAWKELLEEVDRLAASKYRGNSWSAWSEGTPKQRQLVDAILNFPGHVIATMRTKTEWIIEQDTKGRSSPKRVGQAPEQGKGIEYEFDLLMEISAEHYGNVTKDRTGMYQDQIIKEPDEEFGASLVKWLNDGSPPPPKPVTREDVIGAIQAWSGVESKDEITQACTDVFKAAETKDYVELMAWINERKDKPFAEFVGEVPF